MRLGSLCSTGRLPDGPLEDNKTEDAPSGIHAFKDATPRDFRQWAALGASATPTFRLLNLPEDIIDLILHFVALQRYSYSDSRRPNPSPLEVLSVSRSPILRWRCLALLYHRGSLEPDRRLASPAQFKIFNRFRRLHHLTVYQGDVEHLGSIHIPPNAKFLELSVAVTTHPMMANGSIALMPHEWTIPMGCTVFITSALTVLRLRHVKHTLWLITADPSQSMKIRRLELVDVDDEVAQFLVEQCKALTELKLKLWSIKRPIADCVQEWDRLEVFELECRPWQKSGSTAAELPLETALRALIIPPHAALRFLSVTIFLSNQSRPSRTTGERICAALACFASVGPNIQYLYLDEYTLLKPQDIGWLAETFPNVRELHLGDRTVWDGGRDRYLSALARFTHLAELELPQWPQPVNSGSTSDMVDPEVAEWIEPEHLVLEMAGALPSLSSLGLSGASDEVDWTRIGWHSMPGGESQVQLDPVTRINMDLNQPC